MAIATVLVAVKTYLVWVEGPWDLPRPGKVRAPLISEEPKQEAVERPVVGTETIVRRNLFDPERGAGAVRETEATSLAYQKIRSIVLLGTAILGQSRYAILLQPADANAAAPRGQAQPQEQVRVKLGDTLEGFRLSEIHEKNVVFTKGATRIEVGLDYLRKVEEAQPAAARPRQVRPSRPVAPRATPNVPRRQRPAPENP